jgi:TrmH family RNA methyltransferase
VHWARSVEYSPVRRQTLKRRNAPRKFIVVHIPVRIVLVDTSHPGNIGATARAMKTMGLTELALVRPKQFPSEDATARAAGADDVLAQAAVHATLASAIADCGWVVGASARLRTIALPIVDPRVAARQIWLRLPQSRVAVVMGPEQSGLTNEDLARCNELVHIPAVPEFSSLNLAMAAQVLCYELRMAAPDRSLPEGPAGDGRPATAAELEGLHEHLERLLTESGFLHPEHQRQVKLKLRRIFHKAGLEHNELAILRGALTSLDPRKRQPRGSS